MRTLQFTELNFVSGGDRCIDNCFKDTYATSPDDEFGAYIIATSLCPTQCAVGKAIIGIASILGGVSLGIITGVLSGRLSYGLLGGPCWCAVNGRVCATSLK